MTRAGAIRKFIALIWVGMLGSQALAECDFPSHVYRNELADPAQIQHISVEIRKSRKWFKNSISILASDKRNIDDRFKKKFRATLTINYAFGRCKFPAKVRQNGDWKDHIRLLPGGNVVSSLDVRLLEGNIHNAVRFKLFLPETRRGLNEIMATMVLRDFGYITPKTFMVSADINNVFHAYLFQEKAAKELLERNLRREGPILEGDESLIWNYEDFDILQLQNISLSRLSNGKWAAKGNTSAQIAVKAFLKLQIPYLLFANGRRVGGFWGPLLSSDHENNHTYYYTYTWLIKLMNGGHALIPHNRKFYFNSFNQALEPIYYDGEIDFLEQYKTSHKPIIDPAATKPILDYVSPNEVEVATRQIDALRNNTEFRQSFVDHSGPERNSAATFYDASLNQLHDRLVNLQNQLKSAPSSGPPKESFAVEKANAEIMERGKAHGVGLNFLELDGATKSETNTGRVVSGPNIGTTLELSPVELIEILSDSTHHGNRTVLLPNLIATPKSVVARQSFLDGDILSSEGATIVIDSIDRTLTMTQTDADDWVLIRGATLENWAITLDGRPPTTPIQGAQRFNEFGLTGCLNFYDVTFVDSTVSGRSGQCEDSINIVSSRGTLSALSVQDGFADAIDIDFSQVKIARLDVSQTGNDCFDVSTGQFVIATARLIDCGDKGISVGENSDLVAQDVFIENAVIGVSSKDFSDTRISKLSGRGITMCAEAFQKKQEYGGAKLTIEDYSCEGDIRQDENSAVVLNGLMQ